MALFFIDTSSGQVATGRQLVEAGIADGIWPPPRPWLRIQGTDDATTMWYAVLRRVERGVHIGTLALRHTSHHASLLEKGWREVHVSDIRAPETPIGAPAEDAGSEACSAREEARTTAGAPRRPQAM